MDTTKKEYAELRRDELGSVKYFLYYQVLIKAAALIMALSMRSGGRSIGDLAGAVDSSEKQEQLRGFAIQGFLLFNLIPAAIILAAGIFLGWALAPTLILSALGFIAALAASFVILLTAFCELGRAAKAARQLRNDELRGAL